MANSSRPETAVAVFDLDNTLIKGDSLWAFFFYAVGWPRVAWAIGEALALFAARYLKDKTDPALGDERTFIKAHLLQRLLAGKSVDSFAPAIKKLSAWAKWNEPVVQALRERQAQGCVIVIATGSLDFYLPELLKTLPPHETICTRMEIKDGVLTGVMSSGNCVRRRKAEMVGGWLAQNGPFAESWGYGNYPHDVPMLALVKHRVIV